jgi:hypothetical protein
MVNAGHGQVLREDGFRSSLANEKELTVVTLRVATAALEHPMDRVVGINKGDVWGGFLVVVTHGRLQKSRVEESTFYTLSAFTQWISCPWCGWYRWLTRQV